MDNAELVQRERLIPAFLELPGQVERLACILPGLLDHVPVEALMGKVAGLIATGGSDHHYLSIDYVLRPVLMWFNMHLVPGSVYARSQQIQGQEVVDAQVRDALAQLGAAVVAMHQRLQGGPMGPPPLSLMGRRG